VVVAMIWTLWLVAFDRPTDADDFTASLLAQGLWVTEPVQTDLLLYSVPTSGLTGSSLAHPLTHALRDSLDQGDMIVDAHLRHATRRLLDHRDAATPQQSRLFVIGSGDDEAAEALRRWYGAWTWARRAVRRLG
jgi:hypothetical protein